MNIKDDMSELEEGKDSLSTRISKKLDSYREEKKITRTRVAKELKITRSALYKKINGDDRFNDQQLEDYAKLLNVEISLIVR